MSKAKYEIMLRDDVSSFPGLSRQIRLRLQVKNGHLKTLSESHESVFPYIGFVNPKHLVLRYEC